MMSFDMTIFEHPSTAAMLFGQYSDGGQLAGADYGFEGNMNPQQSGRGAVIVTG